MKRWRLTYADGQKEDIMASDLRAALIVLPDGTPVLAKGHPDTVVKAELVKDRPA